MSSRRLLIPILRRSQANPLQFLIGSLPDCRARGCRLPRSISSRHIFSPNGFDASPSRPKSRWSHKTRDWMRSRSWWRNGITMQPARWPNDGTSKPARRKSVNPTGPARNAAPFETNTLPPSPLDTSGDAPIAGGRSSTRACRHGMDGNEPQRTQRTEGPLAVGKATCLSGGLGHLAALSRGAATGRRGLATGSGSSRRSPSRWRRGRLRCRTRTIARCCRSGTCPPG